MRLSELSLQQFRNYEKEAFIFHDKVTLFVGGNGAGKTNALEAAYLLSLGKSFRAQKVDEMIQIDTEYGRVVGTVLQDNDNSKKVRLEVMLTRGELQGRKVQKRRFSVDGVLRRIGNFQGQLVSVLFRPEDLELVLGSPSIRREFLNGVLSQVDHDYRRSLISYEKALIRRNRVLDAIRDTGVSRTQLTFWDQLLIKHGRVLSEKREALINFINQYQIEIDSFKVRYDPSPISEKRLDQYANEEVQAGYTLVGPHKDDFMILFDRGNPLAYFGSRGEQRLAVLWIKLAELAYDTQAVGEHPLLLLDDIFSELDKKHRKMVFNVIHEQQTLITSTERYAFLKEDGVQIIEVGKK
jgi:DNA replication and repair protein RecF